MTRTFDRTTERYFALLEALTQAVIATDTAGTIIHWGKAAEKLYGWRAAEVIGKDILEVTPADVSREEGSRIMTLLMSGEAWSGEFSVRGRTGAPFLASVTDVPLVDGGGDVVGVIGVSAPSQKATDLRSLLKRFAKACKKVWPRQFAFDTAVPRNARLSASEPHLVQLLSVLLLQYADALDRKMVVEFTARTAENSPFAEFGLVGAATPAVYIRLDRKEERPVFSVLRNIPDPVRPRQYAPALVRMVGGLLIAGTAPERTTAMHLFLPMQSA